ncbi:uncharacterized protein N7469_011587 [Penicillium citrinum]|uniref:Uncharacterized protein n=2 Tax=Penicillium TaxID=5073 RepID=A0A9W9TBJ9_PENCI|nr:uncharacterized protein N7469_011587 [Penicillium citrinum]KAJ5216722.1 hypothetical protein N7469_011587 [Penicillium citrinum]KAJ5600932.1 hypothetical protein N7450_001999 [Penicillium hetheringtonii]KAK5807700.1 hypothetical protein VI817_001958 [Penicillium citrinum]
MSVTTTSSAAAASCTPSWQIPVDDVACAGQISGNITKVFDTCCKGNSPVKYNDDCNIYCLAQGQTKQELTDCLTEKSGNNQIFCGHGKQNATATAEATTTKETGTSTGTSTSSTGTSTETNAAVLNQPISKTGLGLVAMLFCSALVGVVA